MSINVSSRSRYRSGFTLVELMVTLTIIGILSLIVYASFGTAREQTRDKSRMAMLKELQLAIETYKAQTGRYPAAGCSGTAAEFVGPGPVNGTVVGLKECNPATSPYIVGLVPEYIDRLPQDMRFEDENNRGIYYRTDGASYKLMFRNVVENLTITNFTDEFARCPKLTGSGQCSSGVPTTTYAVYSLGAEDW